MSTDHIVRQGEYLSQIAQKYGFLDYKTIWNHPKNAKLQQLRHSPNVLMPGDTVYIPDKLQKEEACPTAQTHRFKLGGNRLFLHLALKDFDDQPLANAKCELNIDGKSISLTTDGSGHLKAPIGPTSTEATLTFHDPSVPFDVSVPIKIGHLDPVEEVSGQKARLSNLGYITCPIEELDDTTFRQAVQEFQCDFGLHVNGMCNTETQAKLKNMHGS